MQRRLQDQSKDDGEAWESWEQVASYLLSASAATALRSFAAGAPTTSANYCSLDCPGAAEERWALPIVRPEELLHECNLTRYESGCFIGIPHGTTPKTGKTNVEAKPDQIEDEASVLLRLAGISLIPAEPPGLACDDVRADSCEKGPTYGPWADFPPCPKKQSPTVGGEPGLPVYYRDSAPQAVQLTEAPPLPASFASAFQQS